MIHSNTVLNTSNELGTTHTHTYRRPHRNNSKNGRHAWFKTFLENILSSNAPVDIATALKQLARHAITWIGVTLIAIYN